MKRLFAGLCCLVLLATLGGCASLSFVPQQSGEEIPLPTPAAAAPEAPVGDSVAERIERVTLQYLGADQQQLVAVSRSLRLSGGEALAEKMVERLLELPPDVRGVAAIAPDGTRLLWAEATGDLVTVNLSSEALGLSAQGLVFLRAAIANTLTSLPGVGYVAVLIEGQEESTNTIPNGALSQTDGNLSALWAQRTAEEERFLAAEEPAPLERDVALYFASEDGGFLLPEVRRVKFTDQNYTLRVVSELAQGAQRYGDVLPREGNLLTREPSVETLSDGRRCAVLDFDERLIALMERDSLNPGQLYASLALTLCRFVPELDAVAVRVGGETVGRTVFAGQEILFEGGVMTPDDFGGAVGANARLYFAAADGSGELVCVERTMDLAGARTPRRLLEALIAGPNGAEPSAQAAMTAGATGADLLGIRIDGEEALVNLSSNWYRLCQSMDKAQERCMVYAIVNTLCDLDGVRKVRFYVEGDPVDSLVKDIYLRGPLLPNPGIVRADAGA